MASRLGLALAPVLLAFASGCLVDLPAARDVLFACASDDECAAGFVCASGACVSSAFVRPPDGGGLVGRDGGPAEGPDGGAPVDAGVPSSDAGAGHEDGGAIDGDGGDGGGSDAGDAGGGDAGEGDAGGLDADGGAFDAGVLDAGDDGGAIDAGPPPCPGAPLPPACDPGDADLAVCMTFDDDSATDGSSYGNHGSPQGVSFVDGLAGRALRLQGSGGVFVADGPSTDDPDAFSVSAWLRPLALPAANGTRQGIVDDDGQYGFFVVPGGYLRCTCAFGAVESAPLVQDEWVHVACTFDGAAMRLYVDGALVDELTGAPTALLVGNGNGVAVGANSPGGDALVGDLDELRIFNRALSPGEICWAAQ